MRRKFSGLLRLLFGRTTLMVALIALQVVFILVGMSFLDENILIVNGMFGLIAAFILIYLLNSEMNTSFKLMWIILIMAIPFLGVSFYFFTKMQPGTKQISETVAKLIEDEREYLLPERDTVAEIAEEYENEFGIFKYLYEEGNYPVYDNASVKFFPLGEDKFEELLIQLERAQNFIFMEYFIVDKGYMWDRIVEVLERKAREGVEVRVLYDGTCTLFLLPYDYPKTLEAKGIQCRVFSPMKPFLSTYQNNRDHRKIVVIDGHTAFNGGVNLADEYINRRERFGHWKDTAVMLKGACVDNFTLMFLQMWNVSTGYMEDYTKYVRQPQPLVLGDNGVRNGGYVCPYGDSPLDEEYVGKYVYMDIINRANKYVHIMTPYLILDEEMRNSLVFAAQRGIDVKIIMPHIPDKKSAYYLARTHYRDLISKGVKIYEYTPGFVHAKIFTSDDRKAVVGTINMDFRSLFLHFECATYILDNPVVNDIEADYNETLAKCQRVTLKDCREFGLVPKVVGQALKLVAPLM